MSSSVSNFKPPINYKNLPNLLQNSMNLKPGGLIQLMNENKEPSQLRQPTPTNASHTAHVASKDLHKSIDSAKDGKRKQLRSNTQERVLRMADE